MKITPFFLFILGLSNFTYAQKPLWTLTRTTATSVVFPTNLTSSILYTITNESTRPHTLVIQPLQGVTQMGPCHLSPKGQNGDQCTLNLSITGAKLPPQGISGGPIVCEQLTNGSPNKIQCYQPAPEHILQIKVGAPISEAIDWRTEGVVTAVKNQGTECQSGYAFSTVGAIESFYAINTNLRRVFSEQQIIDCSNNMGCQGGSVPTALNFIIDQHGIATAASYPYTAQQGSCRQAVTNINVNVTAYTAVPTQNEIALAEQVEKQPVSARIKIGEWFQNYSLGDGVINPNCNNDTQYQDILIVGYTPDYWIIKNSYGRSWGEDGYLYLIRGINACGIADSAFAPTSTE